MQISSYYLIKEKPMLKGIHPGCFLLWIFPEKEEGGVIFEKEINIYAKNAILKRFQANETSISITQGKISALISESELVELQNSKETMYSKLASVQMDVSGLTESLLGSDNKV